ncbi:Lacal_2735 family protein [Ekhidna sp.]|uniref:Lacal_2735 family protein n=1 Tax=Ekhidna sp. TaxID=2608089 RepID=UPI00329A038A
MLNLFKRNSATSLQKKYDKLMKEAYVLSKSNPEESKKKQVEAQELQKLIIALQAA